MEVRVKGNQKKIRLNKNNFIAAGGEGQIYAANKVAFKIYTKVKNMLPFAKIQELSAITNSNVIKPEKVVLNTRQKPIGYTMKHISDTYALCQIFPKGFRDRMHLDGDAVLKLIRRMQSTISDIHNMGVLIVDLNEMNFLVDKKFKEIYFIDVDSYQTQSFPATAIMESIRDRHTRKFSQLTDWFSFGIVSFQMFVGIHPYKGKHPKIHYPHDKPRQLNERMEKNIPVFHKDVRFPQSCLPFGTIPKIYQDWYKAIFFEGKRVPPPTELGQVIIVPVVIKTVSGNEDFEIIEIFEYSSNIVRFLSIGGIRTTVTSKDFYINNKIMPQNCNQDIHVGITPLGNKVISATLKDGCLLLFNSTDNNVPKHDIRAEDIMSYKGRIFIKNKDILSEIKFVEMGSNIHAVPHHIANVMENATKLFDGVAIQNILGSFIASIFPSSGTHHQIQCPEFQGYQIVDAKYDNNVLMVIASQKGKYDKFILKFDEKFSSYSIRKVEDISYCGINFAVLDNGIVIHINENEEIEIFSNKKDKNTVKVIDSSVISGDMKLFNDGAKVVFAQGKKLYQLKMKKGQ